MGVRPARRQSALLRRSGGLVAQTRWLFCLCAVLSLGLGLPGTFLAATGTAVPVALAATTTLVVIWVSRYLTGRAPLVLDLVEAAAVAAMAGAGADPSTLFGFVFPALWYRALFGSTARVFLLCACFAVALFAGIPLQGPVPEFGDAEGLALLLPTLGGMFVTTSVARHLARGLFAREKAQSRDAALVRLGNRLIGLTDRAEIRAAAAECATALCAATPGLRALLAFGGSDGLAVVGHAGAFDRVPTSLPRSTVPAGTDPDGARPVADTTGLTGVAAPGTAWMSVPLTDQDDGWILLGAPRRVPTEAIVAVRVMTNLVALAMRTSNAHTELVTQATHDALTGLANRSAFLKAVERALAEHGRSVALLFLDLDGFKSVNDRLGHAAGDELLRHVAGRLRRAVRPTDLCARLGGDEFAVLLSDAQAAAGVAQRLMEIVAGPVVLTGEAATIGTSVGLAVGTPTTSAEELVQRADVAMYAAKAAGRNRVQAYHAGLLRDDTARFEEELASAAADAQLVVHYQPIVSVADDRCVAVEALVRWQHPERGLLGPAEFIGPAERTGAIGEIGAFVLRHACAEAASWTGPAGPLALHVNVSAVQLTDPGFLDVVRHCLVEHDREPDTLVLEVTEGMALDSAPVRLALHRLAALGVIIAVDDFGTGYSALSIIRSLPLDIVKLDRAFLFGAPPDAADEAVVAAVVQMAGRLGLSVIAEGVERADQQRFLRSVGVDAAQGHLHLHATSADRFAHWLQRRSDDRTAAAASKPLGSG